MEVKLHIRSFRSNLFKQKWLILPKHLVREKCGHSVDAPHVVIRGNKVVIRFSNIVIR